MPALLDAATVTGPIVASEEIGRQIVDFHRDVLALTGAEPDLDLLRAGPGVTHRDLVDALLDGSAVGEARPELVVIAHSLPDLHPFTTVGPHLTRRLGGGAEHSFGISQQGLAAPFTALRLIAAFQRRDRATEAVLAVLEQTTLPAHHHRVHGTPLVDSGVLLRFGVRGGPRVTEIAELPDPAATGARLDDLAGPGTLLVTGPNVERRPNAPDTHRVDRGSHCTSVWLALGRWWREWQADYRTVVLCDVDPDTRRGYLAVLTTEDA
ncbi:hypothetical protein ACQPYE_19145 [Actinosynnema sp. CA-299493]